MDKKSTQIFKKNVYTDFIIPKSHFLSNDIIT